MPEGQHTMATATASIVVDGVFVDCPIVHKAERIIALADAIATRAPEQPGANVR